MFIAVKGTRSTRSGPPERTGVLKYTGVMILDDHVNERVSTLRVIPS